jgi:hypothetical protein
MVLGGGFFFFLSTEISHPLLSPGPLHRSHQAIDQCSACHGGRDASVLQRLSSLSLAPDPEDMGHQCLFCHDLGGNSFGVHGLPLPSPVAPEDAPTGWFSSQVDRLACQTCHREHRGVGAPLTAFANERCQSCHDHGSFQKDHPELASDYGVNGANAIAFDHQRHFTRHFPDANQKVPACATCHNLDSEKEGAGSFFPSFDRCASCHDGDVHLTHLAGRKGLPLITVPGVDVAALSPWRAQFGSWPQTAEASWSPLVLSQLLADDELKLDYERTKTLDWLDLREARDGEKQAVARLLRAFKRWLLDWQVQGNALFVSRGLSFPGPSPEDVKALVTGAFPLLDEEASALRSGEPVAEVEVPGLPERNRVAHSPSQVSDEVDLEDELLLDDDDLLDVDLEADLEDEPLAFEESQGKAPTQAVAPDDAVPSGGWFHDAHVLYWRPSGHGDSVMKSLILRQLSGDGPSWWDAESPGRCLKCHLTPDQSWRSVATHRPLTPFSHTTHAVMTRDCRDCHRLAEPESRDPLAALPSEFSPLRKNDCQMCHRQNLAMDDCRLCHRYHHHRPSPVKPLAQMP